MKKELLAWMAGIVDGEGSICLMRTRSSGERPCPIIEVPNTTDELVVIFKETFGGSISNKKRYKKHHSPSKQWKLTNRGAIRVMGLLLPYLRHPLKRSKAKLIVSTYLRVTPRNGRYTAPMLRAKKKFEKEFFELHT